MNKKIINQLEQFLDSGILFGMEIKGLRITKINQEKPLMEYILISPNNKSGLLGFRLYGGNHDNQKMIDMCESKTPGETMFHFEEGDPIYVCQSKKTWPKEVIDYDVREFSKLKSYHYSSKKNK
jgi:hypothetical protein